jgi:voltage-gated potassium channel
MKSRRELFEIVFGTKTLAGKRFDIILLWVILASVLTVIMDSIVKISDENKALFLVLEWIFTILFTIEYITRIYIVPNPRKYIFSLYGIIDLISWLPTYISLLVPGAHFLIIFRLIRLLRIFRILNLTRFLNESKQLYTALAASVVKISIFMLFLLIFVIVLGTILFVVEGGRNGFESIPQSVYWAISTVTTVGYGDIVPITGAGKFIASLIMLIGYSIIAVPTGIVTMQFTKGNSSITQPKCEKCGYAYPEHSRYCNQCGTRIENPEPNGE